MAENKRKKCCNCKELFIPDPRNAKRQKYCHKPECRKASKAASQKRWLQKPENRDYFSGPENVKRVQLRLLQRTGKRQAGSAVARSQSGVLAREGKK